MAKKPQHTCTECGYTSPKWLGRCPECGAWGSMEQGAPTPASVSKVGVLTPTSPATPITSVDPTAATSLPTGISELDRVLGSGIVPGSVILLAGEPGVGKSTLLLEVASKWAKLGRTALYVTAEESAGQVRMRAQRTDALVDSLYLASESELDVIFGHARELTPSLLIVDSVQTMHASGVEGVAGGVAQTRAVTAALTTLAKTTGVPIILVGHVTKDGNVAGPRVLEHLVDVVLHFEGDRHLSLRMLRGIKNRFGATDEVGCFEQRSDGIHEVPDPTGLFLSHRGETPDGTAVTVAMDGVRPMLTEVQALVVHTESKSPRRAVTGLDATRVPMVLAVLGARGGKPTHNKEVYVATVGGLKIGEPAADLAIALATASALSGTPLPPRTIVLGEVGLAGEIRAVPGLDKRLQEAARLGYERAILPAGTKQKAPAGLEIRPVGTIKEALLEIERGRL
ncbi:DNA repair protein RadA [Corynebacterium kozikiae]|uniref:DNA repair protein RadA n=1 Tax=Corynebacterium kozikiae TaxID=2968469 RepID=UPI00211C0DDB|nr:DNA repair protein RadA [Corynebacterium sp. 76QC2CO]MCQ9343632.1 DNA repair protein RadA [Corynebacterium sp. 76QC2CO]